MHGYAPPPRFWPVSSASCWCRRQHRVLKTRMRNCKTCTLGNHPIDRSPWSHNRVSDYRVSIRPAHLSLVLRHRLPKLLLSISCTVDHSFPLQQRGNEHKPELISDFGADSMISNLPPSIPLQTHQMASPHPYPNVC